MTRYKDAVRDRARTILEHQLATVDSPDRARATAQKVLKAAGDSSEADRSHENGRPPGSVADQLGRVARSRSGSDRVAAVLVETATQSLAPTKDAQGVAEAAYDVLGTGYPPRLSAAGRCSGPPALDSMSRPDSLEGHAFLAVSGLPHPAWLHALCEGLGGVATGGWLWVAGTLVTYLLKIDRSDRALKLVTLVMAIVAFTAERSVKAIFVRRRPFRHRLGIMLLGGKPRRRSFPSGHAATSFAGAWILGSVWPERRPMLLGLAALVSVSRSTSAPMTLVKSWPAACLAWSWRNSYGAQLSGARARGSSVVTSVLRQRRLPWECRESLAEVGVSNTCARN